MKWRFLLAALFCLVPPSVLAQAPDTFTFTGSMSIQRQSASATLISGCNCPADGKVLIAGGVIDGDLATTNTADLYDPANGKFTPTGTMNVARSGQAAVLLAGGKVLIVGAIDSVGPEDAEIYDPVAGTFSCVAGTDPTTGTCNATLVHNAPLLMATLLQSGKVLITGLPTPTSNGQVSNAAAIYDPLQATFTCMNGLSSTPGVCNPSMSSLHTRGTATLLGNGTVLIAGGSTGSGYTSSAEIYDPASGTNGAFTTTGSLLTTRGSHTATLLNTGEVLVAGGTTDTGSIHNLNTAEVFANGTFASVGNMAHVRVLQTATLLNDGTVLIAGGCCEVSNLQMPYAEIYNPSAKTFAPTMDMNEARATHTATLLPNGQVLVAGGFSSATAELYTPTSFGSVREFPIYMGTSDEPTIAVDPLHPMHAVVAYNQIDATTGQVNCGWSESQDGGVTWKPGLLILSSPFHGQGDPWVRYSPNGELFYSCIGVTDPRTPGNNPFFKTGTAGLFVAASSTGLADDLNTQSPVTQTPLNCTTKFPQSILNPLFCDLLSGEGEFADHPSIATFTKFDGSMGLVVCWIDTFLSANHYLKVSFSNDNAVSWSKPKTLDSSANVCNVGGGNSGVGVTWWNSADNTLKISTSSDGLTWSNPDTLAPLGPLVQGISATSLVLNEPYALIVPGTAKLRAIWQSGGSQAQIFVGDAKPHATGVAFSDPDVENILPFAGKFLPGAGNCSRLAGAYEVTTSTGEFRYKVWPIDGSGPVRPLFASGQDLDSSILQVDDRFGFRRIGDYTGVDCSGSVGWAVWTDLRDGKTEVWGAVIPLP